MNVAVGPVEGALGMKAGGLDRPVKSYQVCIIVHIEEKKNKK